MAILGQKPQSALASLGGTTQALQRVQQAATGKAREAGPIQAEAIPEQVALQEVEQMQRVQTAREQQVATGLQQKEQAQQQELKFGLQDMDERETNATQEMLNRTNSILQEFEQGKARLDNAKDKAKMEQALFGMRLANKKYTDQLQIEGRKRRLDNAVQFKEALMEAMFKEELDLLKSDIKFKRAMAADERNYERYVSSFTIESALRVALQESDAENTANMIQGLKGLVSGGLQGYSSYQTGQEKQTEMKKDEEFRQALTASSKGK